jgi:hypothetical protein
MTIELKLTQETNSSEWDKVVSSSPHGTIFHTWKWLKIVEKYTGTTFYPLTAYRGTNIVAIYPIFVQKKGFIHIALSPPPHAYLLYLGPVMVGYEKKKLEKKEDTFVQLQRAVDTFLFQDLKCKYSRIRLSPGLSDSRPLRWCGYTVEPLYTYRTNLGTGLEEIWNQFDRKVRANIDRAVQEKVVIREGKKEDLVLIENEISRRRKEQGFREIDHYNYLNDLFENYPEHMKIFLAEYQSKFAGGVVALVYGDTMYLWIGMAKTGLKSIYPNDLLQWEAMKWAARNGITWFESMDGGANRRLTSYKSKWNPEIVIWYSAVKHSSIIYEMGERLLKLGIQR